MLAAENEISARAWKLSALFCVAEHPNIYDSRLHLLPEYVRGLLLNRLQHMREKEKTMKGVNLLSFIMPRTVQNRHEVQVFVILHGSHVLGLSTVKALLNLTIGVTVTCKPLDFGPGKDYADVASHPIYAAFLSLSSKNTGPDVDASLFLRVDIEGNSDAKQETISKHEEKYPAWKFTAIFDSSLHPELVQIVNDRLEVSDDYIRGLLNPTIVPGLAFFSFAVPLNLSNLRHPPSVESVHVTGMLRCKATRQIRRRTVEAIFPELDGLTSHFMPIQMGRGNSFTLHQEFEEYLKKSTKDRAEAADAGADPNLLFRVDVSGTTDDAQPRKRGPVRGSSRRLEPLDCNQDSMLLARPLQKSRAGRGDSGRSAGSRDETATPPPTPPAAAPRLASAPSVIPRRPPPPHTHRRRPAAQPCRRVPD